MAKQVILEITEQQEIDGQTIVDADGAPKEFYAAHIVRATPNSGGTEYIRLHTNEGSYKWNAPLDDWSVDVDHDPDSEARWEAE